MPLTILVAGAGITGLAAAAALRRAGHSVHVYERSRTPATETGAAINVPPNASRPLLRWGMDPAAARMVVARRIWRAEGTGLGLLAEMDLGAVESTFGAPWLLAHRGDLSQALWRLAHGERGGSVEAWSGPGEVTVHLGQEVVGYVSSAGDGERVSEMAWWARMGAR